MPRVRQRARTGRWAQVLRPTPITSDPRPSRRCAVPLTVAYVNLSASSTSRERGDSVREKDVDNPKGQEQNTHALQCHQCGRKHFNVVYVPPAQGGRVMGRRQYRNRGLLSLREKEYDVCRERKRACGMKSKNVISPVPDDVLRESLKALPQGLVFALRRMLKRGCPDLREKLNVNSLYLGYARCESDALYVHVQKKCVVLDIRVPKEQESRLVPKGFAVHRRDNWQGQAGWLTGIRVPHDTTRLDGVVRLALYALEKHRLC